MKSTDEAQLSDLYCTLPRTSDCANLLCLGPTSTRRLRASASHFFPLVEYDESQVQKTLLILEKVFQLMVYLDRLRFSLHLNPPFILPCPEVGKLLCRPAFSLLLGVAVTPNAQRVWAKNRNCVISTFWFSLCTFYTTSKSVIGLELL